MNNLLYICVFAMPVFAFTPILYLAYAGDWVLKNDLSRKRYGFTAAFGRCPRCQLRESDYGKTK